ncbi:hypothetical protein AUC31_10405 [Planococcus rifietoensis]|uniref:Uncharacterized protein n=1 Tax=Planococcus rifietoensis TaxID=200991 RepID=A0A0U2Z8S0_9BACL|nr:hypothetical protein [Planococcus rifietoensis]ALS75580.1 hypothetical protein AUC31_10405 [Planococcus rifietoensis]
MEKEVIGKASAFRLRFRGLLAVGRVLSQRAAKCAPRLSRQPARSHRRQPPFTPSPVLEGKEFFSVHSTENVEMLPVFQLKSSLI